MRFSIKVSEEGSGFKMFSYSGRLFSRERGKLENSTRRGKSQVQQLNFPPIFVVVCVTAAGSRIDLFSSSSVKI
jgi:hypothetical protein